MKFTRGHKRNVIHGGRYTRLYKCWCKMKERSLAREDCEVYAPWQDFIAFRDWAVMNGYSDDLVLCRTGDTGNYSPNNVRWDTKRNNHIEAKAKHYTFVLEGEKVEVYNLSAFCTAEGLCCGHMSSVHSGKRKQHKGYTKFNEVGMR